MNISNGGILKLQVQTRSSLIERLEYENNNDLIRDKLIPDNIPVLMFTGVNARHFRKDPIGKAEDMHAYAKMQLSLIYHLKDAKQIIDWGTGHSPQRDKPEEVAREINEFIDQDKTDFVICIRYFQEICILIAFQPSGSSTQTMV